MDKSSFDGITMRIKTIGNGFVANVEVSRDYRSHGTSKMFFASLDEAITHCAEKASAAATLATMIDDAGDPDF